MMKLVSGKPKGIKKGIALMPSVPTLFPTGLQKGQSVGGPHFFMIGELFISLKRSWSQLVKESGLNRSNGIGREVR